MFMKCICIYSIYIMFGTEAQTICGSETVYQLQGNIGGGKKYQHIYIARAVAKRLKQGRCIVSHLPTTFQSLVQIFLFPKLLTGGGKKNSGHTIFTNF
jgi:hypothetical protein